MTQVKTKRIYEKEEGTEGFRVFIDKLWPRGIKKEALRDALWAKDLAPSTSLRKWYHEDEEARWNEFRERYTQELRENPAVVRFIDRIKREETITLLYASKNRLKNHALILQDYVRKVLKESPTIS